MKIKKNDKTNYLVEKQYSIKYKNKQLKIDIINNNIIKNKNENNIFNKNIIEYKQTVDNNNYNNPIRINLVNSSLNSIPILKNFSPNNIQYNCIYNNKKNILNYQRNIVLFLKEDYIQNNKMIKKAMTLKLIIIEIIKLNIFLIKLVHKK